jgi:glutathione S-transferase
MTDNSEHVWVYGGDHSPWVQSLLLGLHEKNIPHTVVTVPPLSVFLNSGILMPAAKIGDGPWLLDSARILSEFGFSNVDDADRRALNVLFGGGALQRTVQPWDFWYSWSYLRDGQASVTQRLWNHLRRPFSVFYFFALITLGRLKNSQRTEEELIEDFAYWDRRLESGSPFLGGEAPDTVDLQLFGQLQMFSSVPCRSLRVIQEAAALGNLRGWVERMQARFAQYDHLYSGPYFEPRAPGPRRAPHIERLFYWLGCVLVWGALPLSLAATFFFVRRVNQKQLR